MAMMPKANKIKYLSKQMGNKTEFLKNSDAFENNKNIFTEIKVIHSKKSV